MNLIRDINKKEKTQLITKFMDAFKVAVSIFECGRVGPGESDEDRECNYTAVSERTKETKNGFTLAVCFSDITCHS